MNAPAPLPPPRSDVEASVGDEAQRLEAIARHMPGVVYSYDRHPDGRRELHYLGPGFEDIIGPKLAAEVRADFDRLFELIHPDDAERVRVTASDRAATGETFDHECRLRTDDGDYAWVRSVSRPIRLDGGGARWHVVLIDVTERKRVEEREQLLIRELNHRVKNNMAAVLSLAEQSIGSARSLADFRVAFTGRIRAMAVTHEVLARRHWDGVDLEEAVTTALSAFAHGGPEQVTIDGPRIRLGSRVAMPLGLALHELATNAAKHGALAEDGGRVEVRWTATGGGGVALTWRERVATPIVAPCGNGLGLDLVRGLVQHEIGGRVDCAFPAEGLRCEITLDGIS
ncbi:MAG: PAS domain-containing protein [Planctomycetes bacterium]|nr:PAS domain-containing protein [Planctomycetota bacterium]